MHSTAQPISRDDSARCLVVQELDDLPRRSRRVAIGNFDGVHPGHASIIRGCDTVLTFDPHPLAVLSPAGAPPLLTPLGAKAEQLARLGVREVVLIRFDGHVARQTAERFVQDTLLQRLGAVHVSVGDNFRYGARGAGTAESLRAVQAFTTAVGGLVHIDGDVVSSSRIRAAVAAGDVEVAARLLGRPHRLPCLVTGGDRPRAPHGDGGSVRVGFEARHACPPPGTYECAVSSPGPGAGHVVTHVQVLAPSSAALGAEARILGHAGPLRCDELTVEFLRRAPCL